MTYCVQNLQPPNSVCIWESTDHSAIGNFISIPNRYFEEEELLRYVDRIVVKLVDDTLLIFCVDCTTEEIYDIQTRISANSYWKVYSHAIFDFEIEENEDLPIIFTKFREFTVCSSKIAKQSQIRSLFTTQTLRFAIGILDEKEANEACRVLFEEEGIRAQWYNGSVILYGVKKWIEANEWKRKYVATVGTIMNKNKKRTKA